jgi:uncharacterized protein (TIGR00369 family)
VVGASGVCTVTVTRSVAFEPRDPAYEARVRASFARQRAMHTIGASLVRVEPGEVELGLPFRDDLTQQHGFLHAGIVTALVDSACGYAALSLMDAGAAVLSVEYKVNLLAPARGDRMRAIGRVVKPGRTLVVCTGEVLAVASGAESVVTIMQATMMAVRDRGLSD